jgi:hypothetical protein
MDLPVPPRACRPTAQYPVPETALARQWAADGLAADGLAAHGLAAHGLAAHGRRPGRMGG